MFLSVSFDKQTILWYFLQSLTITESFLYCFQLLTISFENVNIESMSELFFFLEQKRNGWVVKSNEQGHLQRKNQFPAYILWLSIHTSF